MRATSKIAMLITVSLLGAGCATKKYVAKTIAPVEGRVQAGEAKNSEQDKQLSAYAAQAGEFDRDLSRTKERLSDTDAKAAAAGDAAKKAGERADSAATAAEGARTLAQQGIDRTGQLEVRVEGMNKFQVAKNETVLFAFGQSKLTDDAKAQLDELANAATGLDRFVIEVQGFTDKTGSVRANEALSGERAQEVARYLANKYKIPVRSIAILGSGYAQPVGDDKTRDGRKMNRRVEVRLYVPETSMKSTTTSSSSDGSAAPQQQEK